ncbi:DUF2442 domain-containing protein [Oxalobacteraceae bacterium A2-2]
MKIVNAREYKDEPVTEEIREQAVEERKHRSKMPPAQAVRYLPEFKALAVSFADNAAILLPVTKYAEFARLSLDDLERIKIGLAGSALCLEEHDLHVSIAGLVSASKPLMELASSVIAVRNGSRRSAAKVLAARENGHKGGRPRKLAQAE